MTLLERLILLLFVFAPGCLAGAESPMTLRRPSVCASEFEMRAPQVMRERGLPEVSTFFPAGEAAGQELRFPSEICPARALEIAVETLVHAEGPESFSAVYRALGRGVCNRHCFLNRPSTLWGLVADENSELANQLLPEPPGDVPLRAYWIFFLSVSDLSEHGYWALIARDGSDVRWVSQN